MPALHYKEALAAWRHPRPANDNSLITADSFNSLEERRTSSGGSSAIRSWC